MANVVLVVGGPGGAEDCSVITPERSNVASIASISFSKEPMGLMGDWTLAEAAS